MIKQAIAVALASAATVAVAGCSNSQEQATTPSAAASAAASAIQSAVPDAVESATSATDLGDTAVNATLESFWTQLPESVQQQLCSDFQSNPAGSWNAFLEGQGENQTVSKEQFDAYFTGKCG